MGKLQVEKVWAQNNFIDFRAELDQKAVGYSIIVLPIKLKSKKIHLEK